LKEHDVGFNRFIYIGDQKNDMLSTKSAAEILAEYKYDIKTIALSGGATYEEKLKATNPDFFTRNLSEVLNTIKDNIVE